MARNSSITLTMDRYAHVTLKDTAAAVSKLTGPTAGRSNTGAADGGNRREQTGVNENLDPQRPNPPTVVKPLAVKGFDDGRGALTSGEGGIRTLVTVAGKSVFETDPPVTESLRFPGIPHAYPVGSSTGSSSPAAHILNADLARVVELWPVLPPAIRAAILTLANTTAPSAPPVGTTAEERLDRLPPGYEKRADR